VATASRSCKAPGRGPTEARIEPPLEPLEPRCRDGTVPPHLSGQWSIKSLRLHTYEEMAREWRTRNDLQRLSFESRLREPALSQLS
jgi:hypothetical protein